MRVNSLVPLLRGLRLLRIPQLGGWDVRCIATTYTTNCSNGIAAMAQNGCFTPKAAFVFTITTAQPILCYQSCKNKNSCRNFARLLAWWRTLCAVFARTSAGAYKRKVRMRSIVGLRSVAEAVGFNIVFVCCVAAQPCFLCKMLRICH